MSPEFRFNNRGPMETRNTMLTKKRKNRIEVFADVSCGNYEFKSLGNRANLKGLNCRRFAAQLPPYSSWTTIQEDLLSHFSETGSGKKYYCFIHSNIWHPDNRISRHLGLSGSLSRDLDYDLDGFLFEETISRSEHVMFWGILPIAEDNVAVVFDLLSDYENGIIFSAEYEEVFDVSKKLASHLSETVVGRRCFLDVSWAIRTIVAKDQPVIYPYAWKETGTYHMDAFNLK